MDDETLQPVINRIDSLDNRLKEVENQNRRDWIAKIGRVGIIVACVGGILGGANTFLILWHWATDKPNIEFNAPPPLLVEWIPEARRLSFTWVVTLWNKGAAQGVVKEVHAYLEFGAQDTGKRPLDDIKINENGTDIPPFISVRPADTHALKITMAVELTREAEKTFFEEESFHKLILEVVFGHMPQPEYQEFCIYLGLSSIDLREKGDGKLGASDSRCTSSDHP